MNIGFDAKRIFRNTTGLGNYSRTLVSSLAGYFPENNYCLFTPKISDLFNPSPFNTLNVILPTHIHHKIFRSAWRSKFVTSDIMKMSLDVYHGLSNEIPFGIHRIPIKIVVTIHDLIFERYPHQYNPIDVYTYRKKARYACRYAHRIIAVSNQTKKDLISFYHVPADKITVVYQSCDPVFGQKVTEEQQNNIRLKYRLPHKFLLYVGSIVERKNLLTLVKAMELLSGNISLAVVGSGHHYAHIVKSYIEDHPGSHDVRWLCKQQNIPQNDLAIIYTMAKILIYPSLFEGFGLPVREALWSETPVITSKGSCFAETGCDAAIYVNPLDKNEIAQAIQNILNDRYLVQTMKNKGRDCAHKCTPFTSAGKVIDIYNELLAEKRVSILV